MTNNTDTAHLDRMSREGAAGLSDERIAHLLATVPDSAKGSPRHLALVRERELRKPVPTSVTFPEGMSVRVMGWLACDDFTAKVVPGTYAVSVQRNPEGYLSQVVATIRILTPERVVTRAALAGRPVVSETVPAAESDHTWAYPGYALDTLERSWPGVTLTY